MGKVIEVNVHCVNGITCVTDSHFFYKDYGNHLIIKGIGLETGTQVHFSLNEKKGNPIPMIGVAENGIFLVDVPDNLLNDEKKKDDYDLYAFVYSTDENSGWTVHEIVIPVKMRPNGAYENPTREEISAFNLAVEQVRLYAEVAQESAQEIVNDRVQIQKNKEDIEKLKQNSENGSGGGADYTLPQATSEVLGGVKADSKTEEDTVPVKIDEDGKLYVLKYPVVEKSAIKHAPYYDTMESGISGLFYKVNMEELEKLSIYAVPDEIKEKTPSVYLTILCDDGSEKPITMVSKNNLFYINKSGNLIYLYIVDANFNYVIDITDKSTKNNVVVTTKNNTKYLGINNTSEYSPEKDYNPATKKYVDDLFGSYVTDIANLIGGIEE